MFSRVGEEKRHSNLFYCRLEINILLVHGQTQAYMDHLSGSVQPIEGINICLFQSGADNLDLQGIV